MIRLFIALFIIAAAYVSWDRYLRPSAGKPPLHAGTAGGNNPTNAWLLRAHEMENNLRKISQLSSNNQPTQP